MACQLIPPPDQSPPSVKHLTVEKRIQLWRDLVDTCEAILIASMRTRVGPNGDLRRACQLWNERYQDRKEQANIQFLKNLGKVEKVRDD